MYTCFTVSPAQYSNYITVQKYLKGTLIYIYIKYKFAHPVIRRYLKTLFKDHVAHILYHVYYYTVELKVRVLVSLHYTLHHCVFFCFPPSV